MRFQPLAQRPERKEKKAFSCGRDGNSPGIKKDEKGRCIMKAGTSHLRDPHALMRNEPLYGVDTLDYP